MFKQPMKAETVENGDFFYPCYVSEKLDGWRCLIVGGVMYTSGGKPFKPNVQARFKPIIDAAVEEGLVLDGELYHEGENFGTLASTLSASQEVMAERGLRFHCFDIIGDDWETDSCCQPFVTRKGFYGKFCEVYDPDGTLCVPVKQTWCADKTAAQAIFDAITEKKGEGVIMRSADGWYKPGKRSADVVKWKRWDTAEGKIVSIHQLACPLKQADEVIDGKGFKNVCGSVTVEILPGQPLPVGTQNCMFAVGTDVLRRQFWTEREQMVGKIVEFEYLSGGSGKGRMARIFRVREDLESESVEMNAVQEYDAVQIYLDACADENVPQWKRDYYEANAKAQTQASQQEFTIDDDEDESAEMDTVTVWCDDVDEESVPVAVVETDEERRLRRHALAESLQKMCVDFDKSITEKMMAKHNIEESDVVEAEVESNVELDSDGYVTWECFDTLPYLVKQGGISVNLNYRPYFDPVKGMYGAVAVGDFDSFMVEWTGTADYCDWDSPSRIVTLDEYNAENVGNVKDYVPADVPDKWVEDMFPGAESHVKAESVENLAAYVPDMKSALAEMVQCSAIPTALDGSVLATVQREDGRVKSGALLKTRGRGLVFMEWETGFVYRIPAKGCKQSKGQGFTVLTLSDTAIRKERKLQHIFTARSLF